MTQISLSFDTGKRKINTKKKNTKIDNLEPVLKTHKINTFKPASLESNTYALEKIRKGQFPSEVFNIELPNILSPQELSPLYYISYQKDVDKNKIMELINQSIKNIRLINTKKEVEIDMSNLENLFNTIKAEEKYFQEFLEEYENIYNKLNIKEPTQLNRWKVFSKIFSLINIQIFEKEKINLFSNKITPLVKTLSSKHINLFFTEKDYIKSYIAKKSLKGNFIGESFCKSIKDIQSKSIDLAILFIEENKIPVEKEDSLEIRKNTISNKLIDKNIAKEGLITYEAIHPKMKNFGLSVIIGPSSILTNKKLHFKKHELIAIPLFTVYFFDENEKSLMNITATNLEGEKKEFQVNKAVSIFCTMDEKSFMKSPLSQNPPSFFIENLEDLENIQNLPQYAKIKKDLEYINNIRITEKFKKIFKETCNELASQLKIQKNLLTASIIEEILQSLEKDTSEIIDFNKYINKLINYTSQEKRIINIFKIKLIKESKKSIINPLKEAQFQYIKQLAEKVFMKLKSDDIFTLYHLKIVSNLIEDEKRYMSHEMTLGGMFKSEGQTIYAKPFEYIFNKTDFINLCLHVSENYAKRMETISLLENALNDIRLIKSKPQKGLEDLNKTLIDIINKASRKKFKRLYDAFKYLFEYNENRTLDKKVILYFEKTSSEPNIKYFLEILKSVANGYSNKVIKNNSMSKLYSEMPSVIQKIKDLFSYIENKENVVTKVAINKTLQKIESLEEEIEHF